MQIQKEDHSHLYMLFQDWSVNKGNLKSRLVLVAFRLAHLIRKKLILTIFFFWYLLLYRLVVAGFLNIDINWHVSAGKSLRLEHGNGSIIEASTVFGKNCVIRHHTTIGRKMLQDGTYSKSPRIGDNVDIGCGATIIGGIEIDSDVTIGAGAVVTKSVPANSVMIGNPARLLKKVYPHNSIL